MSRTRRSFTPEYRKQIVDSILSGQTTPMRAARDNGLHPSLVHKWIRDHSDGGPKSKVFSSEDRERQRLEAELRRYKEKVGELALENDLLKKALNTSQSMKNANGSVVTIKNWDPSKGGAK